MKVCDVNLSEILKSQAAEGATAAHEAATNPIWLAPEVLTGQPATAASDVYSFGLVLWELLAWRLPWDARSPYQVRALRLAWGVPRLHGIAAAPVPVPAPTPTSPPCRPRQVRRFVLEGGRPQLPAAEALPGPGLPQPLELDGYCALMR